MLLAGLIQAQPSPGTGQTGPAGPRWVTAHRYRGTQTHPSLWNCSFVPGAAVPRRQGTSHGIPVSTKPSGSPGAAQGSGRGTETGAENAIGMRWKRKHVRAASADAAATAGCLH